MSLELTVVAPAGERGRTARTISPLTAWIFCRPSSMSIQGVFRSTKGTSGPETPWYRFQRNSRWQRSGWR